MCRFVDEKIPTLAKIVDFFDFILQIVDTTKISLTLLTNFVGVDFWQNVVVECRPEAEKLQIYILPGPPLTPPYVVLPILKQNKIPASIITNKEEC